MSDSDAPVYNGDRYIALLHLEGIQSVCKPTLLWKWQTAGLARVWNPPAGHKLLILQRRRERSNLSSRSHNMSITITHIIPAGGGPAARRAEGARRCCKGHRCVTIAERAKQIVTDERIPNSRPDWFFMAFKCTVAGWGQIDWWQSVQLCHVVLRVLSTGCLFQVQCIHVFANTFYNGTVLPPKTSIKYQY